MKNNRTSGSKSFKAKLILPFVFLFALLAVILVGIFPTIRSIKNTQNEIVDLKADIEDQNELIPIYLPLKERMEDSLPEGIVASEVVPIDSDDIEDVQDLFETLADKSGVDLISVTPDFDTLQDGKVRLQASIRGKFLSFRDFLNEINQLNSIRSIESFTVNVTKFGQEMGLSVWLAIK